jgi:hypothetical protein
MQPASTKEGIEKEFGDSCNSLTPHTKVLPSELKYWTNNIPMYSLNLKVMHTRSKF